MVEFIINLSKVKIAPTEDGYYLKTLPPYKRYLRHINNIDHIEYDVNKSQAIIGISTEIFRQKRLYLFDDRFIKLED